jgi:hypothetical protein
VVGSGVTVQSYRRRGIVRPTRRSPRWPSTAWVAPAASGGRRGPTWRLSGGGGTAGHCGGGEPWKAVVAGMILTESGEGQGWSDH